MNQRVPPRTDMATETAEIPDMLARQLAALAEYEAVGQDLRARGIRGIVTCARGTSNHAALYFKYLMETRAGLPVASIGPSVASIYDAPLRLNGFACLTFSQSGGSPDLLALMQAAERGQARTLAVVNVADSPLGRAAQHQVPVLAGPERAVAATKSYVGMLFASAAIVAGYAGDRAMSDTLCALPELARAALQMDWTTAQGTFASLHSLYCVGRGPGLSIAAEAALKFKETCHLHAEPCSAAELLHGPISIARGGVGGLIFSSTGPTGPSLKTAQGKLQTRGAPVYTVGPDADLVVPRVPDPILEPFVQAIAFYRFVERLSLAMGKNPDAPPGLKKVTETV